MPFLLASATIRLAPGVRQGAGMLVDAQHNSFPLNPAGEIICDIASSPASIRVTIDELAERLDLERADCEADVHRFVGELHRRRLVSVHQSLGEEALVALTLLPLRVASIRRDGWSTAASESRVYRRYPATVRGVVRGCLEAHQGSMWALLTLVAVAVVGTLTAGAPTEHLLAITVRALALALAWYALLHWSSLVVHELCHLAVARLCRADVRSVYVRRGAMGLVFRARSAATGRAIVVAGALGAVVYLSGALVFLLVAPAAFWTAAALDQLRLSGVVAVATLIVAQVLWLTPITSDGRELWASFRSRSVEAA